MKTWVPTNNWQRAVQVNDLAFPWPWDFKMKNNSHHRRPSIYLKTHQGLVLPKIALHCPKWLLISDLVSQVTNRKFHKTCLNDTCSTVKMAAVYSSETLKATRCYNPEDRNKYFPQKVDLRGLRPGFKSRPGARLS